jgi:5-methyltetrahydrofolate--homocysteine methyltransferase
MLIVGERINTSRKNIRPAVEGRDKDFIQKEAKLQVEAGACRIDVNCGTRVKEEPEDLEWLVKTVQEAVDVPLSIDSPNPLALERGLAAHKGHKGKALVNSITLEKERVEKILPLVKKYKAAVVALTMDDRGMPIDTVTRVEIAGKLLHLLEGEGIKKEDVYFDPLVRPLGTDPNQSLVVLETIKTIMQKYSGVHTFCGLSNISFGLPLRSLLNRNFLVMAMLMGLDAVMIDPLDKKMMSDLRASLALLNKDQFCLEYIKAFREGKLET